MKLAPTTGVTTHHVSKRKQLACGRPPLGRVGTGRQCRGAIHTSAPAPYQAQVQAPALRATEEVDNQSTPALAAITAKEKVLMLLSQGYDNYKPGDLATAVPQLIASCPISKDELARQSFLLGQGTWEVFYAPHIARISSAFGTRFTIQYKLSGNSLSSYVKYSNPLLGSGWLNAAGSMNRKYDDTVEIKFNRFWVDGSDALRGDVEGDASSSTNVDKVIGAVGRAAFFPQFALFPVLYLDEDLCVFQFPALSSDIAVRRIA